MAEHVNHGSFATTAAPTGGRRRRRRRAAVLIAVIVCMVVASMIFVSIVKMAAAGRRRADTEVWQVQAGWLAESGLQRAAWRLASDADYAGETWTLPAEVFAGAGTAVVRIEVETLPDNPNQRLVRTRADYPDHPRHRARHSKQAVVQVLEPNGGEP